MDIVKRDSVQWLITEMDTSHRSFTSCGTDLFDQADEIWAAVLDIVFEQEITPVGVSIYGLGNIYSKGHRAVLEEKVFFRGRNN